MQLDGLAQGQPRHVRGGEPRRPGVAVSGEQWCAGPGGQPGEVVQFVAEAPDEVLVLADDGGQHLFDGRVPAFVHTEVDPPHASGTEPPDQRDRTDPARVVALQRLDPVVFPVQLSPPIQRAYEPRPTRQYTYSFTAAPLRV